MFLKFMESRNNLVLICRFKAHNRGFVKISTRIVKYELPVV